MCEIRLITAIDEVVGSDIDAAFCCIHSMAAK